MVPITNHSEASVCCEITLPRKSTIIDAICFALYGSVPRYGDERLVGRVVSVGGNEAKVSLTFDVAGSRYHATRVVRLGNGKGDALLERDAASNRGAGLA